MSPTQKAARLFFYSAWAVIMTALTYILGAVSLKVLRRKFGRVVYWVLGAALSAGIFAVSLKVFAVAFLSLVVLVGIFSEFEEMGLSFKTSMFFTLLINGLIASGAFVIGILSTGPKWPALVISGLEKFFKPVIEFNPQIQINYQELMLVLPSIILIMWLGAIYVAVLLEGRMVAEDEKATSEGMGPVTMRKQLAELRMPDFIVWAFIASMLGAFGEFGLTQLEAVSANVLNVCFVLFFFQGIAVVSRFFGSLRMSAFWQTLFMALVVLYLFLFVSVLGLTDYWFDFRSRLGKRTEEINRET